jgi:cytochrome c oxidase subunit III
VAKDNLHDEIPSTSNDKPTDHPVTLSPGHLVTLSPSQWGMLSFLVSEASFFSTLIVVYLAYLGADQDGPTPKVLSLSLVICTTICLLTSSATIHQAEKSLRFQGKSAFIGWWSATIGLGILFLLGTAYEWSELIGKHDLTISRNLFGTTFYTLIGFHALHVTMGVIAMITVLGLAVRHRKQDIESMSGGIQSVSWYWHFVDGVWVVVFTVVYVLGR